MANEKSFAKLTEHLEKSANKPEDNVDNIPVQEPAAPVQEPETVVPQAEPVAEPEVKEPVTEEPVAEPENKEPEVEPEVEPEAEEPVEKSKKEEDEDKGKDKGKDKDKKDDKDKGEDKDEKVKKSEEVTAPTGEEFLAAFEAIVKSQGSLLGDVEGIKVTLTNVMKSITVLTEKLEKSAEKPVEEPVAEEPAVEPEAEVTEVEEEVAKSAEKPVEEEEEELEGKSVEFISKSNGIPEIEPQAGEEAPAAEEEEEFDATKHVSTVANYVVNNHAKMHPVTVQGIRQAVSRVKRGDGTAQDIEVFKEILKNI
ncbi:hypothetical protein EMILIAHAH_68 [Bacillus phage vB_BanH_Emiliahah]|nr:hypothetical protein EMILIAHAH_68 [Bacillus phage vB_BanH_Emiliahah]